MLGRRLFLMDSESPFLSGGFDFLDSGFENRQYTCYSIRLSRKNKEAEVYKNNKCVQKIALSRFPDTVDFNNVDHVSQLIRTVREKGLVGLMEQYGLE